MQRLAVDELGHVRFIRAVLGAAAIARPAINLSTSWTTLAIAAGLIAPGQTFNPFADDISILLAAYVIEDVCVTALAGAARLLTNPDNVEAAAGLLGTEAYQAGAIRTLLSDLGAGVATDAISNLRATLSGKPDDVGTLIPGNAYNFVPNDVNSLAFRRTTTQVLNIAYGGGPQPATASSPTALTAPSPELSHDPSPSTGEGIWLVGWNALHSTASSPRVTNGGMKRIPPYPAHFSRKRKATMV